MKTIIAGSRTIFDYQLLQRCIMASGFHITEVVCGCAKGVDTMGRWWAINNNIPVKEFRPDWSELGKSAGPIRNELMAGYADALILIHNGSKGSENMLKVAHNLGLKIYEHRNTP